MQNDEMQSPASMTGAPVGSHAWIACRAETARSACGGDEYVDNLVAGEPSQLEQWQLQH